MLTINSDIKLTYVPRFKDVPDAVYQSLLQTISEIKFIDLQNPIIRNVDLLWAEYLFGTEANEKLLEAKNLLSYLANRRNV